MSRDTRSSWKIDREVLARLREMKKKYLFKTYNALIMYMVNYIEKEGMIPPATYEAVFQDSRPVIITGPSGSGKTTTVKNLILGEKSVFVVDVANEYREFRQIDLGRFFSMDWAHASERIRFVPNSNVEISKAEAGSIFQHLNFIKNSGALKNWIIVVEEGHRFRDDANLRALLIEARKFVKKLIIVTTDWQVYRDIAQIYKPL